MINKSYKIEENVEEIIENGMNYSGEEKNIYLNRKR